MIIPGVRSQHGKTHKNFVGGAVCAALIASVGALNTVRLEGNLRALEAQCVEEGKREREPRSSFILLCDGSTLRELASTTDPLRGVQAKVAAVHAEVQTSKATPNLFALAVLVISAVPWAWYFLLRRIRELRDAIAGK